MGNKSTDKGTDGVFIALYIYSVGECIVLVHSKYLCIQ